MTINPYDGCDCDHSIDLVTINAYINGLGTSSSSSSFGTVLEPGVEKYKYK